MIKSYDKEVCGLFEFAESLEIRSYGQSVVTTCGVSCIYAIFIKTFM